MMKFLCFLMAPVLAINPLRAATPAPGDTSFHCALADEEFTTGLSISAFAAEHYLVYHHWPRNQADLQAQATRLNDSREAKKFFAKFLRLDLRPEGRNLRLDLRFRASGRVCNQSLILHPGKSRDAIMQAATPAPAT